MSSKTSAGSRPEYFVDRSLGRLTAEHLRADGWGLHLIADHYPDDAETVSDPEWIAEGCRRGWPLLTKDKAIRYRADELAAIAPGASLFCLSRADLKVSDMVAALSAARSRMDRAAAHGGGGFWHVYMDGKIRKMWP